MNLKDSSKEEFVTASFYEDEIELPPLNDENLIIYEDSSKEVL